MTTDIPTHTLNDGTVLPQIGFGTYPLRGVEGVEAITSALQTGYRLIDSAVSYENEHEVGEALVRSEIPRSEVLLTTKIPGRFHEHQLAVQSVEDSLRRLGTDYLDLVLIHWPNPSVDRYVEAWQALVDVQERGLVRSIGVSNFTEAHLERVIERTGITPAVNQIELHPAFPQVEMRAVNERLGIRTESWSPLGRAKQDGPVGSEAVLSAAEAHGVEPGLRGDDLPLDAGSPTGTASPPPRWSCAGTCSSVRSRCPSRRPRSGSAATSTCSASS